MRNVWRTVRRICIVISGLKGLKYYKEARNTIVSYVSLLVFVYVLIVIVFFFSAAARKGRLNPATASKRDPTQPDYGQVSRFDLLSEHEYRSFFILLTIGYLFCFLGVYHHTSPYYENLNTRIKSSSLTPGTVTYYVCP